MRVVTCCELSCTAFGRLMVLEFFVEVDRLIVHRQGPSIWGFLGAFPDSPPCRCSIGSGLHTLACHQAGFQIVQVVCSS